jgi:UDP-glucuronate 4-epimerase
MSVLVTGAAGFIGSHLCEALLTGGMPVVGLGSFDDFYPRSVKEANFVVARDHRSFRMVEEDVRNEQVLHDLPEVTSVVHLAARPGVRPSIDAPVLSSDVSIMGTARPLKLFCDREIRAFVFASSSSVCGNNTKAPFAETDRVDHPISPYAAAKRAGELLCHVSGQLNDAGTVCARLFTAFGPRQWPDLAIHKVTQLVSQGREVPMFGDGSTSRDYTYVDDIVDGLVKPLTWVERNPGRHEVVNLARGETITISEMIWTLGESMGVKPRIRPLPSQPSDVKRTFADWTKARGLVGYDPGVGFAEGVNRHVDWFHHGRPT